MQNITLNDRFEVYDYYSIAPNCLERYTVFDNEHPDKQKDGSLAALGLSAGNSGGVFGISHFSAAFKGEHLGHRVLFSSLPKYV